MRRKIVIMGAVLLLLFLLCMLEHKAVAGVTSRALEKTQGVKEDIRLRQFDRALAGAQALDAQWDKQAKMLEMLVDHGSTDDVRYAFSRLIAALEQSDDATAMVYACELEGAIEHVRERQALTMENIL